MLAAIALSASCGGNPATPSPVPPAPAAYSEVSFREAARITEAAATEVFRGARAGLRERDVKTMVDAVFAAQGSGPPAFPHIVAAGSHGLDLHYSGGEGLLVDGELLVIDIGATSNGHCADLSRTYPISGRFTARQRDLYRLVLEVQAAAARAVTGADSLRGIDAAARGQMQASPLRARDASGAERTLDAFFIHAIGHYIGHEVHGADTGFSAAAPLQPGQVVALEPGLYIPSEGIAIRIEDTYLVAAQGLICLSCAAPKLVESVER